MEGENEKYPKGMRELPFDISILANKEMHDGFFAIVFLKSGLAQSHWDKMDGNKFMTVLNSILGVALAQNIRNLDLLISFLTDYKATLLAEKAEKEKQG